MSIQYDYYVGLKDNDTGKISLFPGTTYKCLKDEWAGVKSNTDEYVLRPRSILWRSGSFIDRDFTNCFWGVRKEDCDEEMQKAFTFTNWEDKEEFDDNLGIMDLSELRAIDSEYIKRGYFLVQDVSKYEEDPSSIDNEDLFWDKVSPTVYTNMCLKQIKTHQEKDDAGIEYTVHGYEDYMYYAYPDYDGKEYLVHLLQVILNSYEDGIEFLDEFKNKTIVLLQNYG
jgi:hypothetical protein